MEVFVKVIREDLRTGERKIAATAFLTFVGIGEDDKPIIVPQVLPETKEEKKLFETARHRKELRRFRREESKKFADYLVTKYPWE